MFGNVHCWCDCFHQGTGAPSVEYITFNYLLPRPLICLKPVVDEYASSYYNSLKMFLIVLYNGCKKKNHCSVVVCSVFSALVSITSWDFMQNVQHRFTCLFSLSSFHFHYLVCIIAVVSPILYSLCISGRWDRFIFAAIFVITQQCQQVFKCYCHQND